ncbi:MAG: hypothetical protein AMXMBFR53_07400 [Gemmatimonadota bacterium]
MILFMVYGTFVAALLGLAASRLDDALGARGRPTRWAWLGSLATSLGFGAWAFLRPPAAALSEAPGWVGVPVAYLADLGSLAATSAPGLERADRIAVTLWLVGSGLLALVLAGGFLRLTLKARAWVPARVQDSVVLLSDDFGPAVLGLRAPRVVLPRWALALEPERLRLVVLHEEEHRRSGDVALLWAGTLAVVAAPWNAALWWQLHRLRGAVEIDCDARVLRRGAPAALYGRLLLEMGTHDPGIPLPLAALSRRPSLLERRLTMIVRGGKRGSVARSAGALAVAALVVAVACETPMPTAVRPVQDPQAAAAPADAGATVVPAGQVKVRALLEEVSGEGGAAPVYMVNGERVVSITNILPEDIERVEVVKGPAAAAVLGDEAAAGIVHVITKDAPESLKEAPVQAGGTVRPVAEGGRQKVRVRPMDGARVYVDGRLFEGDLATLDKGTIEKVEVVKGQDPDASSAIYITLKKRGGS